MPEKVLYIKQTISRVTKMLGGLKSRILSRSIYVTHITNHMTYILVTRNAREYTHRMVRPLSLHGLAVRVFHFVRTYCIGNITVLRL